MRRSLLVILLRSTALALALVVAGCASEPKKLPYELEPDSPDGYLVGSITYDGPVAGYRVYYRRAGSPGSAGGSFVEGGAGSIFEPGFFAKHDLQAAEVKGNVFAVKLPAGDYEIYDWAVVGGAARLSPTQPFLLRYAVQPGRSSYAGSFHFRQTNTAGLTVTGARVDYGQAFERDSAVLPVKYPGLPMATTEREPQEAAVDLGGASRIRNSVYVP